MEGERPRHVAVSLPRRVPHGRGHDRRLPGVQMRRTLLVTTLAALGFAFGAPAHAQHGGGTGGREVQASVLQFSVLPADINLLTGDSVMWTNTSFLAHTVTADAGDWTSGTMNNADT